jgi:putative sterol carrier protein
MPELTIQDLMGHLPEFFVPERAAGIQASVQFDISGEQGGHWTCNIIDGMCHLSAGINESADLYFQAEAADIIDIFYRRLNPINAFMQGKLQLKGNLNLASRLFSLFDIDSGKWDEFVD